MVKKIKMSGIVIADSHSEAYEYYGIDYISPKQLIEQLPEDKNEPIEIYINSGGGSVSAGREIYATLYDYPGEITAKIVGLSASIASIFPLASSKVLMSRISQYMIHNASIEGYVEGEAKDVQKVADWLKSTNEALASAYVAKTGKSKEEILAMMDKETWLTADEAVAQGFVDGILEEEQSSPSNIINTQLGLVASTYTMNVLPEKALEDFNKMKALEIENVKNKNKLKLTAQLELLKLKGEI